MKSSRPLVSLGSMIANGFKKKQINEELKTIPPPLLVVYLNAVDKALAEEFAECLTAVTMDVGVIVSVSNYNDEDTIRKWMDPQSISATKIGMHSKRGSKSSTASDSMVFHNEALNDVVISQMAQSMSSSPKAEQDALHE